VLTTLNLFLNSIGVEGAKAIGGSLRVNSVLTSIGTEGLYLHGNRLGEEAWGAIISAVCASTVSKISFIDASGEGIGPAGAKVIGEALRTSVSSALTSLNLKYNDMVDKEAALREIAKDRPSLILGL
jgi:hypothetical protein